MIEQPRSARTPTARARARSGGAGGDDRLAELEARLAKLERTPGLRERGRSLMDRVIPREASDHFRNAGREELLGIRAIVDFWIERIDEAEGRSGSGTRRGVDRDRVIAIRGTVQALRRVTGSLDKTPREEYQGQTPRGSVKQEDHDEETHCGDDRRDARARRRRCGDGQR